MDLIQDKYNRELTDLRISVTDRCNFRCGYCMPIDIYDHKYEFLDRREILTYEEIIQVVKAFVDLGVSKIRLTGGEPLLRKDLEVLIEMLSHVEGVEDIALTTNGYFLKQRARSLRDAGLSRVTVSLDTLDPQGFKEVSGSLWDIEQVKAGMAAAQASGLYPVKMNVVVQRGVNDDEIVGLARYGRDHGFVVRFIEYMDVGTLNAWRLNEVVPAKEILAKIAAEMPVEPIEKNNRSEVAKRYRYADGKGELGIIASVTQPFCTDCTRARISCDGMLYTCLFASRGHDLKTILRTGAAESELRGVISSIWRRREDRYSEERDSISDGSLVRKVEMYHIGG